MLIKSKFSVPRLKRELIQREELHKKLARRPQMVLVHAPLGYGKTSLVANWLSSEDKPVAWLNLDSKDNDVERFWMYFYTAIEAAGNDSGETSFAKDEAQASSVEQKIVQCLQLLSQEKYQDLVLVLDDAYVITNEKIWQQLNYFLDHLPTTVSVVVISRRAPQLHSQHRRARGQLLEIKRQDLAFAACETQRLFQSSYDLSIEPNSLTEIHALTEGWVAALHLMAECLAVGQSQDFHSRLSVAENEVFSYLNNEVFKSVDLLEQKKLLQFSYLDQADEINMESFLGNDYKEMLAWEKHHGFLYELDQQPGVYQLHNLFRKMLLKRLQADKSLWQQTINLKIEWLLSKSDYDAALNLIAEVKDWEKAVAVLGQVSHELLKVGRTDYLESWLGQLPPERLWDDPKLLCIKTWLLKDVDKYKIGDTLLDHAESLLLNKEDSLTGEEEAVLGEIYALKATIARLRNDREETIRFSKQSLKLAFKSTMPLRWRPYTSVGTDHYYRGELNSAMEQLSKAFEFAKLEGHVYGAALSGAYLGEVAFQLGQLKNMELIAEEIDLWLQEDTSNTPLHHSWRYVSKLTLAIELNRLEEARDYLDVLLAFRHDQDCEPLHYLIILLLWLRLLFLQQDADAIDEALKELEELAQKIQFDWPYAIARIEWMRLRLYLMKGKWEQAQQQFDNLHSSNECEHSFISVPNLFVEVNFFLQSKQWGRARELLAVIQDQSLTSEHVYFTGKAKVLEVILLMGEGERQQAEELLLEVVDEYCALGFLNLILEDGSQIHHLLRKLSQSYPKNARLRGLNEHLSEDSKLVTIKLSNRELDIMKMLDLAKSDKEISDVYCISLGTVKTHLRNIYRKLEVKKRGQAVIRAREMGLLG